MRRDSVGSKDSSGPAAHPPNHMIIMSCIFSIAAKSDRGSTPYSTPFSVVIVVVMAKNQKLGPKNVNRESKTQNRGPKTGIVKPTTTNWGPKT